MHAVPKQQQQHRSSSNNNSNSSWQQQHQAITSEQSETNPEDNEDELDDEEEESSSLMLPMRPQRRIVIGEAIKNVGSVNESSVKMASILRINAFCYKCWTNFFPKESYIEA